MRVPKGVSRRILGRLPRELFARVLRGALRGMSRGIFGGVSGGILGGVPGGVPGERLLNLLRGVGSLGLFPEITEIIEFKRIVRLSEALNRLRNQVVYAISFMMIPN